MADTCLDRSLIGFQRSTGVPTVAGPIRGHAMHKGFLKSGHLPTLFESFPYFDLSFMVWVLLGPLGAAIGRELHLDAGQKELMVAVPVLAGAALRVVLGLLVAALVDISGVRRRWRTSWGGLHGAARV